jgi:hypothetical protein
MKKINTASVKEIISRKLQNNSKLLQTDPLSLHHAKEHPPVSHTKTVVSLYLPQYYGSQSDMMATVQLLSGNKT